MENSSNCTLLSTAAYQRIQTLLSSESTEEKVAGVVIATSFLSRSSDSTAVSRESLACVARDILARVKPHFIAEMLTFEAASSSGGDTQYIRTTMRNAALAIVEALVGYKDLAAELAPICLQPIAAQFFDQTGCICDEVGSVLLGLCCAAGAAAETSQVVDRIVKDAIDRKILDILKVLEFIKGFVTTTVAQSFSPTIHRTPKLLAISESSSMRSVLLQALHGIRVVLLYLR
jgi:hypothetical protein